jgi:hypothetical protein
VLIAIALHKCRAQQPGLARAARDDCRHHREDSAAERNGPDGDAATCVPAPAMLYPSSFSRTAAEKVHPGSSGAEAARLHSKSLRLSGFRD